MKKMILNTDLNVVRQFQNFLSWECEPGFPDEPTPPRPVPPAWFAYGMGLTPYCPERGEL